MSESPQDIYDFNKLEDMFEAIDTLTRATSVLASVDQHLAVELAKITGTLMDLSQRDPQQQTPAGSQNEQQAVQQTEDPQVDLDDLTTIVPTEKKRDFGQEEDEIIDVLTGQPIEK